MMLTRRAFLHFSAGAALTSVGLYTGLRSLDKWTIPAGVDDPGERLDVPGMDAILDGALVGLDERTRAVQIMYAIHCAKPYGAVPQISTLAEFLALPRAHCGNYAVAQHELNQRCGLVSRMLDFTDGWHGWVEVQLGGQWEVFDATTNVWLNQPMRALIGGAERLAHAYYTPIFDKSAPDVYRAHLREGWDVPILRAREPFFGKERGAQFAPIQGFDPKSSDESGA